MQQVCGFLGYDGHGGWLWTCGVWTGDVEPTREVPTMCNGARQGAQGPRRLPPVPVDIYLYLYKYAGLM